MTGVKINIQSSLKTKPKVLSKSGSSWLQKEISFGQLQKTLRDKERESFYNELNTLFTAGVDIRSCLDLLQTEAGTSLFGTVLANIKDRIIKGATLSEAMNASGQFSSYEYFSVQIGEEMGNLHAVFQQLSDFYTKKIKRKRQLVSALSYPILILCSSIVAVAFMLYFIVPMFTEIFKRIGGELPFITQQIVAASNWLNRYIYLILMLIVGIMVLFFLLRNQESFKRLISKILLRIPLLGAIYRESAMAKFCGSMALLTGAKIPLLRAMQLVKQMIDFYPIKDSLSEIEEDILKGKSLHESFSRFSIFDARMRTLIRIGEEVNKMDTFFKQLADSYTESVEHKTKLLTTFLEPLIIVLLGLIVGFILIAMYLPMFQMSGGIG